MNKKEVIEKIEKLKGLTIKEKNLILDIEMISKGDVLEIIEQIDEPEKPALPQFVADWLEVCKDNLALSLANSMNNIVMKANNQPDKTIHWLAKNSETFAKAWLYGYEIEKEKLYTVEIPNPNAEERPILFKKRDGKVQIIFPSIPCWRVVKNAQLTEAEIKQDFAWAWKYAKEVKE